MKSAWGDWGPYWKDMIVFLKQKVGDANKVPGIDILQGNLNLLEGVQSFKEFIDLILMGAGSSPIYSNNTAIKTSSEIFVNQEITNETMRMINNLRIDQFTRIYVKALLIGINMKSPLLESVVWDGQGEPPFVLSFPSEENMNKMIEYEQSVFLIQNNLSDLPTELSKINNISKEEAKIRLQEILDNNNKYSELIKPQMENNQDSQGKNTKEVNKRAKDA